MILADTSAWVEFDRATGSPVDRRLTALVGQGRNLATTEPVMMEVLAGARDDVDFARMSDVVALDLDDASLRAT